MCCNHARQWRTMTDHSPPTRSRFHGLPFDTSSPRPAPGRDGLHKHCCADNGVPKPSMAATEMPDGGVPSKRSKPLAPQGNGCAFMPEPRRRNHAWRRQRASATFMLAMSES